MTKTDQRAATKPPKPQPGDLKHAAALLAHHVKGWCLAKAGRRPSDLAKIAGVAPSVLSRWVLGRMRPSIVSADWRDLCAALDLSPRQRRDLAEAYGLDPLTGPGAAPVPVRVDPIPAETGECPECRVWWPLSGGVLARHPPRGGYWGHGPRCPGSGLPPLPCVAVDASG